MTKDFSGQNLRGRLFKGEDLAGANFSGADIRGANFTNANLRGANFSGAKAGLQKRWTVGLVIVTWFLSALLGFITTITGLYTTKILLPKNNNILILFPLLIIIVALLAFFTVFIRNKLRFDRNILQSLHGAVSVTFSAYGTVAAAISFLLIAFASITGFVFGTSYNFFDFFLAAILIAAFVSAYSVGLNLAVAGVVCISNYFLGYIALLAAIFGGVIATQVKFLNSDFRVIAIVANIVASLMGGYGGWQALNKDEKWLASGSLIIGIAATFGTNFYCANLTDANFTKAKLKNTNFIGAVLIRTCFYLVKKIELARVDKTYLENPKVRQWLVARTGEDKNFDRQNMRGVNLQNVVNLVDASFIGADLSEANLQGTNLSRVNLKQTQLDGTDFTGACLTGAYIEDWGITSQTKFEGVRCEYVYMRSPTKENPDPLRKPDNREEVFKDGDFADFIQPIFDTLDLYHNQRVDPRASAVAFKELAENNPNAELEIVAIERRGEDKIRLRVKTATTANKSELSREYFINYNQLKELAEQEFQVLIAEKENQIYRLENMISTALERPRFYAENRTINTGGGNYYEEIQGNYVQGNYYAASEKQSLADAAAEIQKLLEHLDKSYPTDTTAGKIAIATEAIQYIDSNQILAQRLLSALKAGGVQALAQLLNHPAASFVIRALLDWQKTKDT
ncbi:MAG: pentapeptide repeat-containing protein [Rhizonema sp. PD37]|nr:pentapeptide repeat-containing protein [Rhizonema sp. PD37]